MDDLYKVSQYIDPNDHTTFTSGLNVNFRIKSGDLSNSKKKSLRRFLDTASLANQCCLVCSKVNLFGQNDNLPKVECVISEEFERCLLCFMLDKTQAACGVNKSCELSKVPKIQPMPGESSTRPKPRPRKKDFVPRTKPIPPSPEPEPIGSFSKKRKGKEREKDPIQLEPIQKVSSSSATKVLKDKRVRDRDTAQNHHCEKCSCCSCVNHLDRAFQQIRQIEREKFEQKENMNARIKGLEHSIERKDQTIATLKRKKVSDVDHVANLRKENEIYKAKDRSARKRIYELEKALRNVKRVTKNI